MPIYEKDFDLWSEEKKRIEAFGYHKPCREGEIWWCRLGTNIGSEQDGTGEEYDRPVLILKKINDKTSYIVPLTTSQKNGPHTIFIGKIGENQNTALLSQIRLVDTKRLSDRITSLEPCMFLYVRETARKLF